MKYQEILENSRKYLEISGNTTKYQINTMTYFYVFPFLEIFKKLTSTIKEKLYFRTIFNILFKLYMILFFLYPSNARTYIFQTQDKCR
jgi:uncharacterized membrane protein